MRFYDPTVGNILVDGRDVSSLNLASYRKNIGIVPQEVILFGSTIRENIAYGRPDAHMDEIEDAARKAYAYNFIREFPDDFETVVGDRGIKLSGGQRQRIAIARAIIKDPSILILDEATSSLDSESESEVQKALEELMKNRTSIIIAHRLATIRNADRILVIEKGSLVEEGSFEKLSLKEHGIFHKLLNLQFKESNLQNIPAS